MKQFLIFILLALPAGFLSAQNTEAVIKEMTGTVELKRSGSADWVSAKAGDRIGKDTVVSTGFKSTAILSAGNSTIVVRPLTRLSLAELISQNETETINVSLTTGRVRVEVNPPAGGRANFTVQTPSSTASVRGTAFEMNTVNIQVLNGAVNYSPASGTFNRTVTVNSGQESWTDAVTGDAVHPMTAAEIKRALPSLAGQPPAYGGGRLEISGGTLALEITLEPNE
ncbi:MAG: FecR family protein [Treponema sp.]|nr:FecR family protein [Treponema sp.]